jgi:DNA-binding transcriptional MerR regulator
VTAAGQPERDGGLSIGAVLARLRSQFPDITISKIRFLEAEGLVRPARTPSGYRQFTPADVERLRFVLAAQRDHYLPLKVIKEQLDAPERLPSSTGGLPTAEDFVVRPARRMTREELVAEAGITPGTLAELEEYGLIRPGPAGFYDSETVLVARTVAAMTEYGLEPRHLRPFRASAEREVGLLEQIVTPMYRQRDPEANGRADAVAREIAALSVALHTLLVKAGLRRVTER